MGEQHLEADDVDVVLAGRQRGARAALDGAVEPLVVHQLRPVEVQLRPAARGLVGQMLCGACTTQTHPGFQAVTGPAQCDGWGIRAAFPRAKAGNWFRGRGLPHITSSYNC